jgi:hypothetical protein
MRPVSDYVAIGEPVTFYTICLAALRRGEVAIGYRRLRGSDPDLRKLGGVTVNPAKSEKLLYNESDRVIVLAKD